MLYINHLQVGMYIQVGSHNSNKVNMLVVSTKTSRRQDQPKW